MGLGTSDEMTVSCFRGVVQVGGEVFGSLVRSQGGEGLWGTGTGVGGRDQEMGVTGKSGCRVEGEDRNRDRRGRLGREGLGRGGDVHDAGAKSGPNTLRPSHSS